MIKTREMEDGIVVSVKVQPNSSKNRLVGEYADQIKIAVTVAPEKGKANKAVIKLFAKWLGIKNSDIQIISVFCIPLNTAEPTRTKFAPSSIATSKS